MKTPVLVAGYYARMPGDRTVPAPALEAWTCPSCRRVADTPFCPSCGEQPRDPRDLTLRGLALQAATALTDVDGKVVRTFRCLLAQPGALTVAFLSGKRKAYVGPVALFLSANVIFFAMESLTSGLVLTTPLQSHLHAQPWSEPAQAIVAKHLASRHTTLVAYAPRFDAAIALHARSMILVMVASFIPFPALLFRRQRRPFAAHAVFSLHLYAWMLVLLSVATAIPPVWARLGGSAAAARTLDITLSLALLGACAIYLFTSIGPVYGGGRLRRAAAAAALTMAAAAIVLGYRFALLVFTLATT
jgi:hypothetical protein